MGIPSVLLCVQLNDLKITKLPHHGWGSFVLGENYWMEEKKSY